MQHSMKAVVPVSINPLLGTRPPAGRPLLVTVVSRYGNRFPGFRPG